MGPHEEKRLAKEDEDDASDCAHDGDQAKRNVPIVAMEDVPVLEPLQPSAINGRKVLLVLELAN